MFDEISHSSAVLSGVVSNAAPVAPTMLHALPCGVMITDDDLAGGGPFVRYVNPAFEAMTGWSLGELHGRSPRLLQGPRTEPAVIDGLRKALQTRGQWTGTSWNYRRNGDAFLMSWMISPIRDGWIAVQLELPDLMAGEAAFADQPFTAFGYATGGRMLSFPHFLKVLEDRLSLGEPDVTVTHIDIDDLFAATAGRSEAEIDALIRAIGDRLGEAPGVSAIAHADADHYYALFDCPEAARGLNSLFKTPFGDRLSPFHLSATIGAAVAGRSGDRARPLCHSAQIAVKRGKLDGSRRFVWHEPGMTANLKQRNDIERRLRRAIENDELTVAYQPKLNLRTGRIDGAEVLARWRDPVRGAVSPAEFIPVAESTGMISDIWRRVTALALADLAQYDDDSVSVSINVSGHQLDEDRAESFLNYLKELVSRFGVKPKQVEIEITETKFLEKEITRIVQILRKRGFKISIDDFGNEYSNLLQISNIEADSLKIDKSLVDFCDQNARTRAVIRSIVSMADELGMTVVAEGVETEAQLRLLRDLGCGAVQGYLIAKPGDALVFGDRV